MDQPQAKLVLVKCDYCSNLSNNLRDYKGEKLCWNCYEDSVLRDMDNDFEEEII